MKKNSTQYKKGFTLVETLVATMILAVSITALVNVVAQNVFTSGYIKNKFVAISLAQEGIELVRNIQDNALLAGQSGSTSETFTGTIFPSCYGVSCYIDAAQETLNPVICNGSCPPLQISPNGYFNYSLGDSDNSLNERFTRTIQIFPNANSEIPSAHVTVTVEWLQGNALRNVSYETDIFLWID
jgi:prepilin-type N-terminal cleavage/methylation domain-containing protein